jgi:hypothetical protein
MPRGAAILVIRGPFRLPQSTSDRGAQSNTPTFPSNGRALTCHSHKRNGTSTLFAAFEVATGKVTAAHKTRRRRIEFLDFMNDITLPRVALAIEEKGAWS